MVDVPNGAYQVTLTMGDADTRRDKMGVALEGVQVASVTTRAGRFTTRTFDVTVSDGQLTVTLDDLGGKDSEAVINALEIVKPLPPLTVSIDADAIAENAGSAATTGTVTRGGDVSVELIVALSTSDDTEATVPATVTIPAGQDYATFSIDAVDVAT